ncbi:hypothetical protein D9613_003432 [Agrocybe pediades]|uniref:Uncharacterized protein n=1 Tax=Agrocybe pediades TaxID=84607 RepID=A0A8H4QQI9_9AGAR|nr:hypothetical protein D9613_003432 [Agrocybe pediades]
MKFSISMIPFLSILFLCSSTLVASLPAPPSLPIGSKPTTTQSSSPLSLLSSPLGGTNDASSSPPTFSPSPQASSPESEPELPDAGHDSPLSLLELIDSPSSSSSSSSSANSSPSTSDSSASSLSSLPGALDQPSSQAQAAPGASPRGLNLPSTSNVPNQENGINSGSSSSPLSGLSLLGRKVVVLGRRAAALTGDQGKEEAELGEERMFYKRAERFLIRMERASLLARGVKML